MIDLHIHTSASDGTYSPKDIVSLAFKKNLRAIAITDHDTIEGTAEAVREGKKVGLEVIPGVEISVEWNNSSIHILGYYIDGTKKVLSSELNNLIRYREERNPRIIEKLNSLGIDISYDEVKTAAGGGTIGRPHFAQILIEKGYVKNGNEAFRKYLQRGASAYVDKKRLSPQEGIHLIEEAGGIAVLAHPFMIDSIGENKMEELILKLKQMGIKGIEALYPTHTVQQTLQLKTIAEKYNLLLTGGSDFHGKQKPKIHLGTGFGKLRVPYELVIRMKKALKG